MLKRFLYWLSELFYPRKCILCRRLLEKQETDLCHRCRIQAPVAPASHKKLPNLDRWASVWYYEDSVRQSILRFKFHHVRSYAAPYGRFMALMLLREEITDFDLLTWVPVSPLRRWLRGYDQSALIARALGDGLGCQPVPLLKKVRHTPPQSSIHGVAARRANVLGAYQVPDPASVSGKRILLVDDVITTGATAGECARMLRFAGAKSVHCVAVARRREISKPVGE